MNKIPTILKLWDLWPSGERYIINWNKTGKLLYLSLEGKWKEYGNKTFLSLNQLYNSRFEAQEALNKWAASLNDKEFAAYIAEKMLM